MAKRFKRALLVLDMISEFRFPQWQLLLNDAARIAPCIARLALRARTAHVPVIYVNDTGKDWESDPCDFSARCMSAKARGRDVVKSILPQPEDYFLFKPRHSGFFSTPLSTLLESLSIRELLLTGTTSHQCVLFTAVDAYVRDYRIVVPPDCIGAPHATHTRHALFIMKQSLRAHTPRSSGIRFITG
jgi:nicotinamidase-related amidase